MKKLFAMVGLLLFATAAFCQLNKDEKAKVTSLLQSSLEGLTKSVNGLSEAQLNFKPDSTRWSVKECVYHLALSETNIWGWMQGVIQLRPILINELL
jgi:hypothetical protein